MADITMCKDEDCPSCDSCYRFIALPSTFMQSYFLKSPRTPGAPLCEYFVKDDVSLL